MGMKLIQHYTVDNPSGQSSIEINTIPQIYTDLYLVLSLRNNRGDYADYFNYLKFNGSTTGYTTKTFGGWGTGSPYSTTDRFGIIQGNNSTANIFDNSSVYISNYASNLEKNYALDGVTENNATGSAIKIAAGLWSGTTGISSIEIISAFGTLLLQNSSVTLYGITAGSDGTTVVS